MIKKLKSKNLYTANPRMNRINLIFNQRYDWSYRRARGHPTGHVYWFVFRQFHPDRIDLFSDHPL